MEEFCCIPVAGNEREEFGRDRKGISEITIIYYGKITQYLIQSTVQGSEVRAWEEDIMLPTYEIGKEEKNPIFLKKGLSGKLRISLSLSGGREDFR